MPNARSIKATTSGHYTGYEGGRKVREFMTDRRKAWRWLLFADRADLTPGELELVEQKAEQYRGFHGRISQGACDG